ncbi:MAG: hypothetical protein NC412_05395 [Roseburia sp.]|nr:hypothetical protein [Roseburia sp.]MCM1278490.1 hypothetical protein [Robinsoniella sp.]
MKNITSEKIDEIISRNFKDVSENFLNDFWSSFDKYKSLLDESMGDITKRDSIIADFASFKTAMDYSVEILQRSLKELLCEE